MRYFLDTSALVKIYHKEAGTEKVLNIYKSQNSIAISELSEIEFISTVYRKFRDKEINKDSIQLAFFEVYCDSEDIFVCLDKKLAEIVELEKYKILLSL